MAEETKQTPIVKVDGIIASVAVVKKASAEPVVEEKQSGDDNKVIETVYFKEDSIIVSDISNPQQKALDELRGVVKSAIEKHAWWI
ncbi:hypothetical protein LIER_34311 [Lithospermum erythrorhizon]|uniref:Uncharacterized protein n=1 Tax=Lithospermum erythrorhizon TaxID=34254 RepID=A0AAV3RZB1_LITER